MSDSGQVAYPEDTVNVLGNNIMEVGTGIDMSFTIESKGETDGSGIIT